MPRGPRPEQPRRTPPARHTRTEDHEASASALPAPYRSEAGVLLVVGGVRGETPRRAAARGLPLLRGLGGGAPRSSLCSYVWVIASSTAHLLSGPRPPPNDTVSRIALRFLGDHSIRYAIHPSLRSLARARTARGSVLASHPQPHGSRHYALALPDPRAVEHVPPPQPLGKPKRSWRRAPP